MPPSTSAASTPLGAAGKAAAPGGETATTSRLFERVAAAEQEGAASAEQELPEHLPPSTAGRIAGAIGNALLLGGLGAGAFFGYYTYRYTPEEVDAMIEARSQPEAAGPGNQVSGQQDNDMVLMQAHMRCAAVSQQFGVLFCGDCTAMDERHELVQRQAAAYGVGGKEILGSTIRRAAA